VALHGARFGDLSGTRLPLPWGGTLAFDSNGNLLHAFPDPDREIVSPGQGAPVAHSASSSLPSKPAAEKKPRGQAARFQVAKVSSL